MIRTYKGLRVTGVEATLVALAAVLEGEAFEIACEDARRRGLTSSAALRSYRDRFGRRGKPGIEATRVLLDALDPVHAARSTLEVKTRRLLVAQGFTDFEHDNEKWSVPGRHGYRIVHATWTKVTRHPELLIEELAATMAA